MKCIYCDSNIPERGFYCPNCKKQSKCKACSEVLEPDAKICVVCGTETNVISNNSAAMNTIEFSENKSGRTFKAHFTDTVGNHISDSFGIFLANKVVSKVSKPSNVQDFDLTEEAEFHVEEESQQPTLPSSQQLELLNRFFKKDGDTITLIEPRLKANSRRDFGIRLSCIFLYYKKLNSIDKVPRNELTIIAKQANIEDSNFRAWLNKESHLLRNQNGEVELLSPGLEFAKKVINDALNPEIPEGWKVGAKSKTGRKSKRKNIETNTNDSVESVEKTKASSRKSSRKGPSQALKELIDGGFFKDKKTIADIVKYCNETLVLTYKSTDLSGLLGRLTRDKVLNREKNTTTGQYEYFTT